MQMQMSANICVGRDSGKEETNIKHLLHQYQFDDIMFLSQKPENQIIFAHILRSTDQIRSLGSIATRTAPPLMYAQSRVRGAL